MKLKQIDFNAELIGQDGIVVKTSEGKDVKQLTFLKCASMFPAEGVMLKAMFNWTDNPEEFNTSTDKVFISQIQSGREGIDLRTADALVMLNIDFAAVSYWQVRERIQSKDRETAAKVYWIFSIGGIEQKIYKAVHGKKDYSLSYFRKDFGIKRIKEAA
jgi:hypothetical protein